MLITTQFTEQDFDSIKNGGTVSFNETTPKDLVLEVVSKINDFEATFNTRDPGHPSQLPTIEIDAKHCTPDTVTALLDYAMSREDLVNGTLILNIFNLVKQYNSLSEEYFAHPLSYVNSIEQFIDLKASLAPAIKHACTQLAYWYLASLYSLHKTEVTIIDKLVTVPNLYHNLLLASDLFTLSAIFNKGDAINTDELPLVDSAFVYVAELSHRLCITDTLVKEIEKEFTKA